jgi:hypothetical protein
VAVSAYLHEATEVYLEIVDDDLPESGEELREIVL